MHVLTTERLLLRWFSPEDASFVLELMNQPAWIQFIGNRHISSVDDACYYIEARLTASYWRFGFGLWAVTKRDTNEPLGMCGLVKRDGLDDVDIGFAFLPRAWGNGYAREAAAATAAYARSALGLDRVVAITLPNNERSINVLVKIGMELETTTRLPNDDQDTLLFSMGSNRVAQSDARDIDELARRFFAVFTNVGAAHSHASALPWFFTPDASIVRLADGRRETQNVEAFTVPRELLLRDGRLTNFEEREVDAYTHIKGSIATRFSRYSKSGTLSGATYTGTGTKSMQLVKWARPGMESRPRWHIQSLCWEDDPA